MNETDLKPDQQPASILELIDQVVNSATTAAHGCRSQLARDHFEYALALLRESWIAESGQEARKVSQVVNDVREAMSLFALAFNQKGN